MNLIVTLTSTSFRLPVLKYTLLSLTEQSLKPDRIVLNLSKEPYLMDRGIPALPEWLSAMKDQQKVDIAWVPNTGSYRKLLPVYENASDDDVLVTCDDDVIYGEGWLRTLVECAEQNPDAIVCGRARKPIYNFYGRQQSYVNWPLAEAGSRGSGLIPTGVSGVLYRKTLLSDQVMSSDQFKVLAPKQDDLWFNLARKEQGAEVVVSSETEQHVFHIETPETLSRTNTSSKSSSWNRFWHAFSQRLMLRAKGYLGFAVCDNDHALNKLQNYKAS